MHSNLEAKLIAGIFDQADSEIHERPPKQS